DRNANLRRRNTDGLSDNVSALTYTYIDDNEATIVLPAVVSPNNTNIRRIKVDLTVFSGSNTLPFEFSTRPQNLRRLNEKFK
ncbi:MAG: hypothetical protein NTY47_08750, partial [Candidatus Omnitrophica bacterium]|nr:hypothetical protein [Candidatus Omnitrophota bacterium]